MKRKDIKAKVRVLLIYGTRPEAIKLAPLILKMKEKLSKVMRIDKDCIGIKATTNEKLGPVGREEGISCHSVALICKCK